MTTTGYIIWSALAVGWFALLFAVQYPIRKKGGVAVRIIASVIKLLLGTAIAFEIVAGTSMLLYRLGFVLAALYAVLFADAAGDILTLPAAVKNKKQSTVKLQVIVNALCVAAYMIYGTVNMQTVKADRISFSSDKLKNSYKVVFVSDLHVGSSQSLRTTEETIRRIADEAPDFIILGGDLTDEFTTREEMEKTFSLLGKINTPVYYVYGNHEAQPSIPDKNERTYTDEELEYAVISNGIHLLRDKWTRFSDDLIIFGRENYNSPDRKPISEIPARPNDAFVLLADHTPYETEEIKASGADLQLSGHSHAGQLFPLNTIYELAGYDAYGFFRHGDTTLYVSPGVSGWLFPFRTEKSCNYGVITLEPKR